MQKSNGETGWLCVMYNNIYVLKKYALHKSENMYLDLGSQWLRYVYVTKHSYLEPWDIIIMYKCLLKGLSHEN